MTISPNPYRGFRFPPVVIEHAVWLYHCFSLSLRDVELILAARGIVVSYESLREVEIMQPCAELLEPGQRGSHVTPRWREPDSNHRSLREGKGCGQPLQASIAVSDLNL